MKTYPEIHEQVIAKGAEYFDARLNEINKLLEISIDHFKDKLENVENDYGTGIFELDPNDERSPEEIINSIVTNYRYLFRGQFEKVLTESLFIMAYSIFEKHLNSICQNSWLESKPEIKLIDLKGKGVFRAISYLNKVVGLPFNFNDSLRPVRFKL